MLCAQASTKNGQGEKSWRATERKGELETLRRCSEEQAQGALQPGQAEQGQRQASHHVVIPAREAAEPRGVRSSGGHTLTEQRPRT